MRGIKSPYLDLNEAIVYDDSFTRFEYHNIQPYSNTRFGNNDEIRIPVHQQDIFCLPSESQLLIEGTITKATDGADPTAKKVAIVSNGINFLFSEIRYEINGIQIDQTRNVGVCTLMKGMMSLNQDQGNRLRNAGWNEETVSSKYFNYCVPLRLLMGFFEDYKKILVNVKQELILIRSRTDTNMYFVTEKDEDVKIEITQLLWRVPVVQLADAPKLQMMKIINQNFPLQMSFRSWDFFEYPNLPTDASIINWPLRLSPSLEKPRFVIVGFQTKRNANILSRSSVFDKCNVRNVRLHLGTETYPYSALNVDFSKNKFAVLYENYAQMRKNYYNFSKEETFLTPEDFLKMYPLWCIDCSRQNETVKNGSVNLRLEIEATASFAADTYAYCLIITDRIVEYVPFSGIVRNLA